MLHHLLRFSCIACAAVLAITAPALAETRPVPHGAAPAPAASEPAPPLKTMPFQAALKESKSSGTLLLAVTIPAEAESKAKVQALLSDKSMLSLGKLVIVGTIDAAAQTGDEDVKAFDEYRKTHKIRVTPIAFVAIDSETQKPLYTYLNVPTAAALSSRAKTLATAGAINYDGSWLENYADASKLAAKLKRPMLLNFTGSDWCPYCIALEKEVFSTEQFKAYAKANLVLVKLDFPQHAQAQEIKRQNQQLAQKFAVRGYPTVLFTDAVGTKLGQSGYTKGGAAPWIENAKEQLKK